LVGATADATFVAAISFAPAGAMIDGAVGLIESPHAAAPAANVIRAAIAVAFAMLLRITPRHGEGANVAPPRLRAAGRTREGMKREVAEQRRSLDVPSWRLTATQRASQEDAVGRRVQQIIVPAHGTEDLFHPPHRRHHPRETPSRIVAPQIAYGV
jgi:hypothetical protein